MEETKNLQYLADLSDENLRKLWDNVFEGSENYEYINKYVPMAVPNLLILSSFLSRQNGYKVWLIQRKAEGDIIGFIIHGNFYPGENNNIGLNIGLKYKGKGYGSEAMGALNDYLRENGYKETYGLCYEENIGIRKVMEKNGYVNLGRTGNVARGFHEVRYRKEF